jgi:hypothetical protein
LQVILFYRLQLSSLFRFHHVSLGFGAKRQPTPRPEFSIIEAPTFGEADKLTNRTAELSTPKWIFPFRREALVYEWRPLGSESDGKGQEI